MLNDPYNRNKLPEYPFMNDRAFASPIEDQITSVIVAGRVVSTGLIDTDNLILGTSEPKVTGLDHFEVLATLGRGGCGIVYKVFDRKLRREAAIKTMSAEMAATSPARRRFVREARAAAAVRHENVVQIYAVEESDTPYLVMEYIPGKSLHEHLAEHGPLAVAEVLRIGAQVARGLGAAHDQGLVHRDVKPANILVEWADGQPRVKLTDFGIARAADDASLTHSGTVVGTPMYMSPEQARGEAVDHRSDLFSLGSVLYEMTAGRPPFRAANSLAVLQRVAGEEPRPVREIIPETPEWLCDVITRLQASRPEDRFQTARAVADLLDNYLTELTQAGVVRLPPKPTRRLHARWLIATAVLAVCVGIGVGAYLLPTASPNSDSRATGDALGTTGVLETERNAAPVVKESIEAKVRFELPQTGDAITSELRRQNPAFKGEVVVKVEDGRCIELRITNTNGPLNISPLRRLHHLQLFKAESARIADLSPLKGLPLRSLWISGSVLHDLRPLSGMPLETLWMWDFQGEDLSPLAGMPLKYLNCGGGFKDLDLEPLRGLPLTSLNLNCTHVDDLTPLVGMPLEELMLNPTKVSDLSPLVAMTSLKKLFVNNTAATDFRPIRGLPLEVLVLDFDPTRDAAILRMIPTLKTINKKSAEQFWADVK